MWITLTKEVFNDGLNADELSAISQLGLPSDSTWEQLLGRQLDRTTNFIRGYCPKTTLRGPEGTVPDELEDISMQHVRMEIYTRTAGLSQLWDTVRNEKYLQGVEVLKLWARGQYSVVPPETPAPAKQQAPGPGAIVVTKLHTEADRQGTSGLL